MADYYNVTTNIGDAEIAAAIASSTKLAITHIAFGDGNGAVPTPNKNRTTLVREVHRQAVTKYERHPTNQNWIVIETIIPSHVGGFTIREMGIIANGKLISHGSHAPFEKVADSTGVSEYRLKFTQNIKDGNVVSIILDESLIYATQAWVEEFFVGFSDIVDNLTTDDATKPVSAKQAKLLQDNKLDKTGNAATATKLKNARKINDVLFDGSQDIIVKDASKVPFNSNPADQGAYMSWNLQEGLGRTDFINNRGNGGGGFAFWNKGPTDDTPKLVATIDPNGHYSGSAAAAPSIFRGEIRNNNDAHYARATGHYLVNEFAITGLYGFGVMIVVAQYEVINQTYYAHQDSVNGSIATRQSWDGGNNWSGWRSVDKPALGEDGQTWQNVAGSRNPNTTYTNTTGRTIYVYVAIHDTAGGGYGVALNGASFWSGYDLPAGCYWPFSFPVPPGGTYNISWGGNNKNVLHHWWELR